MDDEEPRFELIWTESAIADLEAVCALIAADDDLPKQTHHSILSQAGLR